MDNNNIWIGGKDLTRDEKFIRESQNEFNGLTPEKAAQAAEKVQTNRRDFLKYLGFGLGAATVAAGCDIPVKRALPYVVKPDSIVPGVATYYASSYMEGGDFCPIIVKTREGRPIKIEGNSMSTMTNGGTSARAQASVLSLYDTNRYKMPMVGGNKVSWADLDKEVKAKLAAAKGIRLVTNTILSPTERKAVAAFVAKYPGTKVVTYDPVSAGAILEANEISFGDRVVPNYRFDKANLIVSFGADFLGTWISPVEFTSQYAKNRKVSGPNSKMSRHIQVESHMSMTGSNADNRILVKPSEQGAAIAYLASKIVGGSAPAFGNADAKKALDKVANQLNANRGSALVVSASNNVHEQILINAINSSLGNLGTTVDFANASLQRQGSERELKILLDELKSGMVDTVLFNNCNPVFEYADGAALQGALEGAYKISLGYTPNETNLAADVIAPVNHTLESWGDAEPKRGHVTMIQPTIAPLFDTRQAGLSLLTWAGAAPGGSQPYLSFLKSSWRNGAFANQTNFIGFDGFWNKVLKDGVFKSGGGTSAPVFNANASASMARVSKPSSAELEISFYEKVSIGNGVFSNNPWLQEMPDPVDRTSWGNYLAVPVDFDGVKRINGLNGLVDGDLVELTIGDKTVTVPVIQQFGQMPGTVALAMGYGRENSGICANGVGVNINDCMPLVDNLTQYYNENVAVSNKVGKEKEFSCVQYLSLIHI